MQNTQFFVYRFKAHTFFSNLNKNSHHECIWLEAAYIIRSVVETQVYRLVRGEQSIRPVEKQLRLSLSPFSLFSDIQPPKCHPQLELVRCSRVSRHEFPFLEQGKCVEGRGAATQLITLFMGSERTQTTIL